MELNVTCDPLRLNLSRAHFDILMSVIFGTVKSVPLKFLRPDREVHKHSQIKSCASTLSLHISHLLRPICFICSQLLSRSLHGALAMPACDARQLRQ